MTTKTKIVFCVDSATAEQAFKVLGRCGDSSIRLNDVFTTACRYETRQSLDEFARPPVLLDSFPITLSVQGIQAYRRTLDELGEGMTGTLILTGKGIERIGPGTILEGGGDRD